MWNRSSFGRKRRDCFKRQYLGTITVCCSDFSSRETFEHFSELLVFCPKLQPQHRLQPLIFQFQHFQVIETQCVWLGNDAVCLFFLNFVVKTFRRSDLYLRSTIDLILLRLRLSFYSASGSACNIRGVDSL